MNISPKIEIPFLKPDISKAEIDEVVDTLKSGWLTTGPKTKAFEKELAKFCHTKKMVCLNSATACIEMALRVLEIGPGDEVITSAYTYTATASVICHVGATPVLVDTAKDSYEMDYNKVEAAINEKTKAIIPVDLAGIMCDYKKIFSIVEEQKHVFRADSKFQKSLGRIAVVADAAHALGAVKDGKTCGEVADFTIFSFHAVKNLTTAEGGGLTWRSFGEELDNEIYQEVNLLSLHGQSKDALKKAQMGEWEYDVIGPYYKCNMTDLQAAIGISQLRRYLKILGKRREIILCYDKAFADLPIQVMRHYDERSESSGHLYCVRMLGKNRRECNQIMSQLAAQGIATNVHYKPLPMLTAYKNMGFRIENYPNAKDVFSNEITLPLYSTLKKEETDYIIQKFIEYTK